MFFSNNVLRHRKRFCLQFLFLYFTASSFGLQAHDVNNDVTSQIQVPAQKTIEHLTNVIAKHQKNNTWNFSDTLWQIQIYLCSILLAQRDQKKLSPNDTCDSDFHQQGIVCFAAHYEKTDTDNSYGNREVTHSYSNDTQEGTVNFTVTSEYEQYDTIEKYTNIHVDITYTPNESQNNSSENDNQTQESNHESQNNYTSQGHQTDSDDKSNNSYDDHVKDAAISREFDHQTEQKNQHNADSQSQQKQNTYDNYPKKERSYIYSWCKEKKEKFIGPSKQTLKDQKLAQETTKNQSSNKEFSTQNSKNNTQSDQSQPEVKKQNFKTSIQESQQQDSKNNTQPEAKKPNLKTAFQNTKKHLNNDSYKNDSAPTYNDPGHWHTSTPPRNYSNPFFDDQNHTHTNTNDSWDNFVSSWHENAVRYQAQENARIQQAMARAYYIEQQENKLLKDYGYTFQVPEELQTQLNDLNHIINTSSVHNDYNCIPFYSPDFWWNNKASELYKKIKEFECARHSIEHDIYKQKKIWRKQSLQEIREIQYAQALQEEADRIYAQEEKARILQYQAELLIAYGYKFQLSDKLNRELQQAQGELKNAKNRSTLDYWFTRKYADEQIWQEKLKNIEAEIIKEEESSKRKALEVIVQKEIITTFYDIKDAVSQTLTHEYENQQSIVAEHMILEDHNNFENEIIHTEQEQILKQARQTFEDEKNENIIKKQATQVACYVLQEAFNQAIAHTNINNQTKKSPILNMLSECNTCYEIEEDDSSLHDSDIFTDKQLLNAQYKWKQTHNVVQANIQEQSMIHRMLDTIALADNDMIIELAQESLRSWQHAQQAESEEEYAHHIEKSKKYYDVVHHNTQLQSFTQQATPINPIELDNLLENYNAIIENDNQNAYNNSTSINFAHADRLQKRAQALTESKQQLEKNIQLPDHNYKISPEALGFMMANNMNYAAFDGAPVTNFQHCLTQEILEIIESSACIAANNNSTSQVSQLAKYNCNLAISAQQLNQLSHLEQAVAVTDLSHFFNEYAKALVDSGVQSQAMMDINLGIIDGTAQALQKWGNFTQKLYNNPHATIGDIAEDCKNIGTCLYNIAAKAYEFTPFAYLDDLNQGMRDSLQTISHHDKPDDTSTQTYMAERTQRNAQSLKNGLYGALQSAQIVVENMMNKSLRQNVADGTEIAVDNFITGKVADSLMHLSQLVGNKVLQAASDIKKSIPSDLQKAVPKFVQTDTGQLIAIVESTGENIGAAVAAKKAADNAEQVIKNAAKAKELTKKINELTKPDPKKVDALQKELEQIQKATQVLNPEKLKNIEGIDQIKKFKDYTNNFTELEKLTTDEILYLNLCEWLHPKSLEINAKVKAMGLKITEIKDGITCVTDIHEFDIFHSLLGEMRPGSVADSMSGGHWLYAELKTAIFDIDKIEKYSNGFLDIWIKPSRGQSNKFKPNSFFPAGNSIEGCSNMIINAIQNPKQIINITEAHHKNQSLFLVVDKLNQTFSIRVTGNKAKFFPYKTSI